MWSIYFIIKVIKIKTMKKIKCYKKNPQLQSLDDFLLETSTILHCSVVKLYVEITIFIWFMLHFVI